jgi:hypothetical protein
MKQIKLTDLIDSVIDCLTESDGGHAVGNGDIKDAVLELKEIKALFIDVVIVPKGTLYCEKEEWHDWWKNTETEKECSNCGKVEAI